MLNRGKTDFATLTNSAITGAHLYILVGTSLFASNVVFSNGKANMGGAVFVSGCNIYLFGMFIY